MNYIKKMKAEAEAKKPRKQSITIAIAMESFWYSVARDVSTIGFYFGAFALNKYTLDSGGLGFVIGFVCFVMMFSKIASGFKKRVIRGETVEEVCNRLEEKLRAENFD